MLFFNLKTIAFIAFAINSISASSSMCSCDISDANMRTSLYDDLHNPNAVLFKPAIHKGKEYSRYKGTSSSTYVKRNLESADPNCDSEQIHVSLGYEQDSAVISFASASLSTESVVYYSTDRDALFHNGSSLSAVYTASGTFNGYTEIYYIYSFSMTPPMGEPYTTSADVIKMEDTSTWAYDHKTGEHYANYKKVTSVYYGNGQYNNPDMSYQSPVLHTVALSSLLPDTTYYYRVSGSCDIHQFKIPPYSIALSSGSTGVEADVPESFYPLTLGLTGDLGQTEVSAKSMAALAALEPAAVLLVGDLSYADGWCPSWDTFGRLVESLASRVPVLTTGGNHEMGFGENLLPYMYRYKTPHTGSGSPEAT
jgi:hypothetical protein